MEHGLTMLKRNQPLAIYMPGRLGLPEGKMGHGLLRYSPNPIACVIDAAHAGKRTTDVVNIPRDCPIVATVREARALGGDAFVLGIAPLGGKFPEEWFPDLETAVGLGMSIVNGLHDHLAHRFPHLPPGQWVWDIRSEPPGLTTADNRTAALKNTRVLLIGTDMTIGKMSTALELDKEARHRGLRSAFVATGQIGIMIAGSGVPVDCVRVDFAAGSVEAAVLAVADADYVFVEGQGSLLHPSSTANLPLIRGSCPTHFILCHHAAQQYMRALPGKPVPDLRQVARLYEDLAWGCGLFTKARTAGIALNSSNLDDAAARAEIARVEAATQLPTTDAVRYGAGKLLDAILAG